MQVLEDLLEQDWDGPLSTVGDVPTALLYGVVLAFAVEAGPAVLAAVKGALEPLLGPATERKSLLGGRRLAWAGKVQAEATVRRSQVTLRFDTRVKGKRLEEIVHGLSDVPGARDLKLKAHVRRFLPRASAPPSG